jgi:hypothetical protein
MKQKKLGHLVSESYGSGMTFAPCDNCDLQQVRPRQLRPRQLRPNVLSWQYYSSLCLEGCFRRFLNFTGGWGGVGGKQVRSHPKLWLLLTEFFSRIDGRLSFLHDCTFGRNCRRAQMSWSHGCYNLASRRYREGRGGVRTPEASSQRR